MELCNFFCSVGNISRVFPGVGFSTITFPSDQVLEPALEHSAVDDFLHDVFLFPVYELWWWWLQLVSSHDQVHWGCSQFDHVEDWVKSFHGGG